LVSRVKETIDSGLENRLLRRTVGRQREGGGWRKLHNEELHDGSSFLIFISGNAIGYYQANMTLDEFCASSLSTPWPLSCCRRRSSYVAIEPMTCRRRYEFY
jgi:hypothetical protein